MENSFFSTICRSLTILALTVSLAACDAAIEESTDTSGSTVTNNVASNAGPTSQLITTHAKDAADEFADNTLLALQELYNFETVSTDCGSLFACGQLRSYARITNPVTDIYVFNDDTDTTTISVADLADEIVATNSGNELPGGGSSCSGGVCTCTGGGTVTYAGNLTLTVDVASFSGSLAGDYNMLYDDCRELVTLTLDGNDTCQVAVEMTGTITHDLSMSFSNFQEQSSFEFIDDFVNFDIEQDSDNTSTMTFATSDTLSGTYSADQGIDFDFAYDYTQTTPNASVTSSSNLTFSSTLFNINDLEDFINDSTEAAVCP